MKRNNNVTLFLISTCILVYVIQMFLKHMGSDHHLHFAVWCSYSWEGLMRGEVWRIFTHPFAHSGYNHLFFNLWYLYCFGTIVEKSMSKPSYIGLVFFTSVIASTSFAYIAPNVMLVGISGVCAGLIMACASLYSDVRLEVKFLNLSFPFGIVALVFLFIELVRWKTDPLSSTAYLCHVSGYVGAYFYMAVVFNTRCKSLLGFWEYANED